MKDVKLDPKYAWMKITCINGEKQETKYFKYSSDRDRSRALDMISMTLSTPMAINDDGTVLEINNNKLVDFEYDFGIYLKNLKVRDASFHRL